MKRERIFSFYVFFGNYFRTKNDKQRKKMQLMIRVRCQMRSNNADDGPIEKLSQKFQIKKKCIMLSLTFGFAIAPPECDVLLIVCPCVRMSVQYKCQKRNETKKEN